MNRKRRYLAPALALLIAFTAAAVPATAQDTEEKHETRIHIERKGADDGEETVVSRHKVVFIGEDGEMQEIEGEGEGYAWIDGEHGRHVRFMPRLALRDGGFLGVSTTSMTPELRSHFGAPEDAGVLVSEVVDDSAAFRAGLQVGDIITGVDDERITSSRDLLHAIRGREEGDAVTVAIYRDGRAQDLSAVLDKTEGGGMRFGGHRLGGHGLGHFPRALKIDCEEEGGDCDIFMSRHLDVCGEDEDCNVNISCDGGDCSCSVNGVDTDCDELHGVRVHPDD